MSWNHRVLAHKDEDELYYHIHEVYYDKEGTPAGCTKYPIKIGGENIEGIQWQLNKIQDCLSKPIISYDNFPEEIKEIKK